MSYTETAFLMGTITGASLIWLLTHLREVFSWYSKEESVQLQHDRESTEEESDVSSSDDEVDELFEEELCRRNTKKEQ